MIETPNVVVRPKLAPPKIPIKPKELSAEKSTNDLPLISTTDVVPPPTILFDKPVAVKSTSSLTKVQTQSHIPSPLGSPIVIPRKSHTFDVIAQSPKPQPRTSKTMHHDKSSSSSPTVPSRTNSFHEASESIELTVESDHVKRISARFVEFVPRPPTIDKPKPGDLIKTGSIASKISEFESRPPTFYSPKPAQFSMPDRNSALGRPLNKNLVESLESTLGRGLSASSSPTRSSSPGSHSRRVSSHHSAIGEMLIAQMKKKDADSVSMASVSSASLSNSHKDKISVVTTPNASSGDIHPGIVVTPPGSGKRTGTANSMTKAFSSLTVKRRKNKSSNSIVMRPRPSPLERVKWYEGIPDLVERETILASLSKADRSRQEIAFEILSTEEDYVRDLIMMQESYIKPIKEQKILKGKEVNDIFSNLEQLLPVNQAFLSELKKCKAGHFLEDVGQAFLKTADYLKMYTTYCGHHSQAVVSLQKLVKAEPNFKAFLKTLYTAPDFNGLNLESYLLKPIQRICKYPLLLRELIKSTDAEHKDRKGLDMAKEKIDAIVAIVNERSKEVDVMMKTLDAIRKIKGGRDLLNPTRRFIFDGEVTVKVGSEQDAGYRKCRLFLFNDIAIITKPMMLSKEKYQQLVTLEIAQMTLYQLADTHSLLVSKSDENYLFQLATPADLTKWATSFEHAGLESEPEDVIPPFQFNSKLTSSASGAMFGSSSLGTKQKSHERAHTDSSVPLSASSPLIAIESILSPSTDVEYGPNDEPPTEFDDDDDDELVETLNQSIVEEDASELVTSSE